MRASLVALSLLASLTMPALVDAKPLKLEEFFRGHLVAEGAFRSTIGAADRQMRVKMRGSWNAATQTLTLVEDFVFSDGEKDRKTWCFTRVGPGEYKGTREDVLGDARVFQDGDAIRLRYKALVRGYEVTFDELLVQENATTVRNTADIRWWFLRVGEVDLTIRRVK